ncbi:hypothetical protein [Bdellovibrio sp. NC01]|uniref:hypothetical protein n=1 Tax=Bdellovibrio sp. NC01 TaxID=2220073 RepID=UPI001159D4A8|nr:hypothetical protein [Bdellovibrio sp. NC01]QDK38604.1 hypothetical protein DOE51_13950 [Bdellovibrio sp. NC01]
MKTMLVAAVLTLIGLQAHAQDSVSYVGQDSSGQECSVSFDVKNNIVSFRYLTNDGVGDGYGFTMTQEFKAALQQRQNPITINEGGFGGATLKISISNNTMQAKFRNLLVLGATCKDMHRQY